MREDQSHPIKTHSYDPVERVENLRLPGPEFLDTETHVIFVLGGPGAGKGTQCFKLAREFHMYHLSVGDVLREERDTLGSEYGELIARNMEAGRIGPMEITVTLLERAMRAVFFKHRVKVFLIDGIAESFLRIGALCRFRFTFGINGLCLLGFPRKMDQLQLFEDTVARAAFALLLDSSEEVRLPRLLKRGALEDRQDDIPHIIQKRFETFNKTCMLVVKHLEGEGRLKRINAEASEEEVYADIQRIMIESLCLDMIRK